MNNLFILCSGVPVQFDGIQPLYKSNLTAYPEQKQDEGELIILVATFMSTVRQCNFHGVLIFIADFVVSFHLMLLQ